MIGESASRLVSGYIDGGVVVVFLALLALASLLVKPVARSLAISKALAAVALASVAGILAVTLGVRAVRGGGRGLVSLSWLFDGDLWSHAVDVGPGWLLNVALFVPAGLFVALATRRSARTLLALIALSLLIEFTQSFGLLGASDPADLVANSLGAGLGAGLAAVVLKVSAGSVGQRSGRSRTTVVLSTAGAAIAVIGIGWLGLLAGADARQQALAAELRRVFAGTTSAAIATRISTDDGFTNILAATGTRPSYLGEVGETGMFEARYSVEFFGLHRCVFIRWVTTGFSLRNGSGEECTVFRERPPPA